MAEVKRIIAETLRRESRGCGADFLQRIRAGLIGFGIIIILSGGLKWLGS